MNLPLPAGASTLPPLYSGWMDYLLQASIPEESEATCFDCAMCLTKKINRTPNDHLFDSRAKCCTYVPKIPNFLAGSIFLDQDPEATKGRQAFEEYFLQKGVVRPHGIFPHVEFSLEYTPRSELFGRNLEMRCPYYLEEEGGLCGIWRHRNAICSTWFCKHVRGAVGRKFWNTLRDLLRTVQIKLSYWCLHELKAGSEDFRQMFHWGTPDFITTLDRQIYFHQSVFGRPKDPVQFLEFRKREWGIWLDREKEFYQECSRLVSRLTWTDVESILGSAISDPAIRVKEAFSELRSPSIPEVLFPGNFKTVNLNDAEVRVWAYAEYDPIDLPKSVMDKVPHFDGRKTPDVLHGIDLDLSVLRKLIDFEILVKEGAKRI